MSIIDLILVILTIGIVLYLIILLSLFLFVYWLIKKHPIIALFILAVILAISTLAVISVAGIIEGIIGYLGSFIIIITQYKRLKKALKIK